MTRVKMLEGFPVSPDGVKVEFWPQGSIQVVDDRLLAAMIDRGLVEIVEEKSLAGAPENKSRKGRK